MELEDLLEFVYLRRFVVHELDLLERFVQYLELELNIVKERGEKYPDELALLEKYLRTYKPVRLSKLLEDYYSNKVPK
ncbi:hypothetical protein [Paenibacillus cremeus]|uniref:Uncharacterized protein n=1 Tax=Paenibacillus cremeus TaxID=2163881 RepID=A0A559KAH4_9BACL|nr:hypothetical protein [Paenibacillus cremeus]TVY09099.1 hypothetical protein FPZ49_15425 [Paenibacillus cremeus]